YFDKMVHCGIFAGFVLLWSMLFRRLKGKEKQIVNMDRAILIAIVFGLIIELLQGESTSIYRRFDWWDLVADIIGAFLGAAIFVEIYGPKKEKESWFGIFFDRNVKVIITLNVNYEIIINYTFIGDIFVGRCSLYIYFLY